MNSSGFSSSPVRLFGQPQTFLNYAAMIAVFVLPALLALIFLSAYSDASNVAKAFVTAELGKASPVEIAGDCAGEAVAACSIERFINARYALLASDLIVLPLTLFGAVVFSAILLSRLHTWVFVVIAVVLIGAGAGLNALGGSIHQYGLADHRAFTISALEAAAKNGSLQMTHLKQLYTQSVWLSGMFSWAVVSLSLGVCALLCLRGNGAGNGWSDPAELRRRRNSLLFTIAVLSVFWTMTAGRVEMMTQWPLKALSIEAHPVVKPLFLASAEAYSTTLRYFYSTVMLMVTGVAILALNADIGAAAHKAVLEENYVDEVNWRDETGLRLDLSKIFAPLIALLPVLTQDVFSEFGGILSGFF